MPSSHYHWPSENRKLHVALAKDMPQQVLANFDVFARLMNIPKNKVSSGRSRSRSSSTTMRRELMARTRTSHKASLEENRNPTPVRCCFILCAPVEKQITIIILTTISGICAQVERNKRQNETQLNFRDVPKDPKEPGRALEGHRFEYSAAPLDCGRVAILEVGVELEMRFAMGLAMEVGGIVWLGDL
ncbi:uncharacterized protein LOC113563727 [Drosophila erecta]|uniref:uncharacterized protein LOC113563727 n=1 Tax=Drosophila erecta TaxID=7220 RepID=UPI000F04C7C7|nr:uncharacterized protein LOC113563727 [Drosophila erecta]